MDHRLDLEMPDELSALEGLMQSVVCHFESNEAPPRTVYAAELALEELITNIIKYGYDDDAPHLIKVTATVGDNRIRLEITDDGHEFNPFAHPTVDTALPLEEREEGGLGIQLVRKMLENCRYERRGGLNVTTVEKSFRL